MSAADFLRLPRGAQILVAVMLWPAIWAAALAVIALAADLTRSDEHRRATANPLARRRMQIK